MNIPATIIPMHASELNERPIEWGDPVLMLPSGNAQSIAEALKTMPRAGAAELIKKQFGGIAVRSTRQNLGVPDQGLIHRGQWFECLTQGTVVVKFYNPDHVPNPKVYLRLWKNPENVPQAIPGSFEATDDGENTMLMENMLHRSGDWRDELIAEVALLPRRRDKYKIVRTSSHPSLAGDRQETGVCKEIYDRLICQIPIRGWEDRVPVFSNEDYCEAMNFPSQFIGCDDCREKPVTSLPCDHCLSRRKHFFSLNTLPTPHDHPHGYDENCPLCRVLPLPQSRADLAGDAPTLLEGAKRFFGAIERLGILRINGLLDEPSTQNSWTPGQDSPLDELIAACERIKTKVEEAQQEADLKSGALNDKIAALGRQIEFDRHAGCGRSYSHQEGVGLTRVALGKPRAIRIR